MLQVNLYFLLFLSLFATTQAANLAYHESPQRSSTRAFVESQCQDTRYHKLCVNTFSNNVNLTGRSSQQLAHIALKVSLVRTLYTRTYLIKVAKELKRTRAKDYQPIKDCLDQIDEGVDLLTRSVKEIEGIKEDDERHLLWQQSNVQTWTSAALTNAISCMDGFSNHRLKGGKMRAIVKAKVTNVAQVISNALALFNRYVTRHRASRITKP